LTKNRKSDSINTVRRDKRLTGAEKKLKKV